MYPLYIVGDYFEFFEWTNTNSMILCICIYLADGFMGSPYTENCLVLIGSHTWLCSGFLIWRTICGIEDGTISYGSQCSFLKDHSWGNWGTIWNAVSKLKLAALKANILSAVLLKRNAVFVANFWGRPQYNFVYGFSTMRIFLY